VVVVVAAPVMLPVVVAASEPVLDQGSVQGLAVVITLVSE
jgi:hypothetical protein